VPLTGLGAMLIWALVHVRYLVGWGNRLVTTLRWLWTMLARNRAERVISTPARVPEPAPEAVRS
jgi:NADH dehydrogenase